jgi:hypothetical protein
VVHSFSGMETRDQSAAPVAPLLERLAAELGLAGAWEDGARDRLSPQQRALLLGLARDVAHAGERQDAPLASYLVGRFVQARVGAGISPAEALQEAAAALRRVVATGGSEG